MNFSTREATARDALALANLHVSTWREAYSHLLPEDYFSPEYVNGRHKMWAHVLTHPRTGMSVHVAESYGELVGFAWAGPSISNDDQEPPRDRQLYAIYLNQAHYGSGAAQALLDHALATGPALLWVAKENPRAIAFYARNRFQFDGTEQVDPYAPAITDARMVR